MAIIKATTKTAKKKPRYASYFFAIFLTLFSCAPARLVSKPEWRLQAIQIHRLNFSGASFDVRLELSNPNPFALGVERLHYRFFLNDVGLAEGEKEERWTLPAHGVLEVSLPVQASLAQLGGLASLLASHSEPIRYRLEGEVTLRALGVEKRFSLKSEKSVGGF